MVGMDWNMSACKLIQHFLSCSVCLHIDSVFVLYGMAGAAFSYVISLFVPSQLAAMAATSLVQTLMAMLFFLG